MADDLTEFYQDFFQGVQAHAAVTGSYSEDAFFEMFAETLTEAGEVGLAERAHYEAVRGVRVDGYGGDPIDADGVMTLLLCDYRPTDRPTRLTGTDLEAIFRRGLKFVERSLDPGFRASLEETSPAYELAGLIAARWGGSVRRVRLLLMSNRVLSDRVDGLASTELSGVPVTHSVWDIERLFQYVVLNRGHEAIEIDLSESLGGPVPALSAHLDGTDYESYLVVVPGEQLAAIYDRWGTRLLEQNVRVFLQARGKVNKGMKITLDNKPEMFFAYNNGITATADSIETSGEGKNLTITGLKNLQIVNGGQTTASIHAAFVRKADLSRVFVQMKLSVIDPNIANDVVPKISEYANTQNRVSAADFFSNHPFHVRIEKISRRLYAPSPDGSFKRSKWFYERARGQYQDARAGRTPTERRKFDAEYPRRQLITKTDLAKFLGVWEDQPHVVAQGAQKNFMKFAESIAADWERNPDQFSETYYQHAISKAIVFRKMELLVSKQDWYGGGYRAQIVAHGIAKLAADIRKSGRIVDFNKVWQDQDTSGELDESLVVSAGAVKDVLLDPPHGTRNISEWAKKQPCWFAVERLHVAWPSGLDLVTIPMGEYRAGIREGKRDQRVVAGIEAQMLVVGAGAEFWSDLLSWDRERRHLTTKEKGVITACALVNQVRIPTERQSEVAIQAVQRLRGEGFDVDMPGDDSR